MGKTTSKGIIQLHEYCVGMRMSIIQNYMYASGLLQVSQCSARNSLKELVSYLQTLLHTSTKEKSRDEVMRNIEENILKDFVEL